MKNLSDYTDFTLAELIEKISSSRYWNLPKQAAEAFRKVRSSITTIEQEIIDLQETTTAQYQVYTALLTQTGTDAPTTTILGDNTIGNIVWTRASTGVYRGTLTGAFQSGTTLVFRGDLSANLNRDISCLRETNDRIAIYTFLTDSATDGLLAATPIEIRVYN